MKHLCTAPAEEKAGHRNRGAKESSAPGPRVNCVIYAYIDTSTQAHGTATPDTAPQLSTIPVRSPKPTAPTSESPPALVAAAQRTTTRPPRRAVLSTHRCLLRQLWGRLCQLVCHAGDRFDTQRPAAAAYQLPALAQLTRSKTRTGTHAQDAQFAATARQEVGSP